MASHRVSFSGDLKLAPHDRGTEQQAESPTSVVHNLGGMCIRDYQMALLNCTSELKAREQQVDQLYSCLMDREETIARLNKEIDSLKEQMMDLKEQADQHPDVPPTTDGRRPSVTVTHGIAGDLAKTVQTPQVQSISTPPLLTRTRRDRLRAALAKNNLLGKYDYEQADGFISKMSEMRVSPGESIITEGEPGTILYVMEEGEVDILRGGKFVSRLLAPVVFGELAVIYNAPRSATVTAATYCRLWTIDHKTFHRCMSRIRQRTINRISHDLHTISIFRDIPVANLASIVDAGEELRFNQGSNVSLAPDTLYVVTEGWLVSRICSCGDVEGHTTTAMQESCQRDVTDIRAVSCFGTRVPESIAATAAYKNQFSDIKKLSEAQMKTLKASEDNITRVTCYRLDTNSILRALSSKSRSSSVEEVAKEEAVSSSEEPKDSSTADGDQFPGINDLAIVALMPAIDSFSHSFCVVDTRNQSRRNAMVSTDSVDLPEPQSEEDQASSSDDADRRGPGCYFLRWILRHRADAAGMGERLRYERQHLVASKSSDFIVQLVTTMQDPLSVYFVFELCLGGTVEALMKMGSSPNSLSAGLMAATSPSAFFSIRRPNRGTGSSAGGTSHRPGSLEEDWARFYLACVMEALEFLHAIGIVHRNVCPAAVYIAANGYAKLGDFVWTKSIGARSRTFSLCGGVERLAPEVMLNKGHGMAADRWACGVLLYEMIIGKQPFLRDDPMMTCTAILQTSDSVDTLDFPRRVSKPVRDAIRRLCRPCPADRIMFDDLRKHALYSMHPFDWTSFQSMQMQPPYLPMVRTALDCSNIPGVKPLVGSIPVSSLTRSCNNGGMAGLTAAGDALNPSQQPGPDRSSPDYYSTANSLSTWSKDF